MRTDRYIPSRIPIGFGHEYMTDYRQVKSEQERQRQWKVRNEVQKGRRKSIEFGGVISPLKNIHTIRISAQYTPRIHPEVSLYTVSALS